MCRPWQASYSVFLIECGHRVRFSRVWLCPKVVVICMREKMLMESVNQCAEYDIIICGTGIAGLTLARQIAMEVPDASLLLIEGLIDKRRSSALQVGTTT